MIVFGPSLSPYVRKVLVFAAEKGLEVEQNTNTGGPNADPAFRAASPFGKIPAFTDGDFSISDSTAIVSYLERIKPEPSLVPSEARAHATAIWLEEFADDILGGATVRIFFNRVVAKRMGREPNLEAADKAEKDDLPKAFAYLETIVPESGFLVGDALSIADIAVASPCVNLGHMNIGPDAATYPKTAAYIARILARPSFAKLIEAEKAFFAAAA